jgi:phage baseplate assembly protein W
MAQRIAKIDPIDLQQRKAVGISLPFNGDGVFKPNYQTSDAIKVNLINFLLTGKGERYMNPTFGTDLRSFLFEQIDTEQLGAIEQTLKETITINFPRVLIKHLILRADQDRNSISLSFEYAIKNTNTTDTVTINFV